MQVSRGPSVTRFELQPNAGVKVSKIVNLADDIALNLAASGVRIEHLYQEICSRYRSAKQIFNTGIFKRGYRRR